MAICLLLLYIVYLLSEDIVGLGIKGYHRIGIEGNRDIGDVILGIEGDHGFAAGGLPWLWKPRE